jgi:Cft2 family RNA processing exonuclease
VRITYTRGLYLPEIDLWMDSTVPRPVCFVSHAHADHIARHRVMIASPATARLAAARQGAVPTLATPFGERRDMGAYAMTLFPAGHCLGSAQALVEREGERLVYTGDFKLRASRTSEPPVVVPCDTLVMEVTFGHPTYRFPSPEEVADRLTAQIDEAFDAGEVPVVLGYELGKAQEALALLVERGYEVAVHSGVMRLVEVYREFGVAFDGPGSYARYERGKLDGKVFLAPPGARKQPMIAALPRKRTIFLTGWGMSASGRFRYGVDAVVPFSDHADYDELLRYVAESGARRVVTLYGDDAFCKAIGRELGVEACHLDRVQSVAATQMPLF